MKKYTRLERFERSQAKKSAVRYSVLTVGIGIVVVFFGLPLMAKMAGVALSVVRPSEIVDQKDTLAPAPPRMKADREYVNTNQYSVTGSTEPGSVVSVTVNAKRFETTANAQGEFSTSVTLKDGKNEISATATDNAGNKSSPSKTIMITLDTKEPEFSLDKPKDGDTITGSDKQNLVIQGTSEVGSSMTINDRFVLVNEDGEFSFTTKLSEGSNEFLLKATDKAGNTTEQTIKVTFSL